MNQQVLRTMAEDAGLPATEMIGSTVQQVRAIQRHLGQDTCFCTDKRLVCGTSCRFKLDCRSLVAEWLR